MAASRSHITASTGSRADGQPVAIQQVGRPAQSAPAAADGGWIIAPPRLSTNVWPAEFNVLVGIVSDTIKEVRRVVLDSSVLVAGFRSRRGASFRLLEVLRAGRFEIALSVPLALEYEAVLVRHARVLGLRRGEAEGLVDYLCQIAHRQEIHFLWRPTLVDPRDEFILELAVAADCDVIVTHNVRDFVSAGAFRIRVVAPAEFLASFEASA